MEALQLLMRGRKFTTLPSWSELFHGLPDESVPQLRRLYDALTDPARAEFDRRYGRPDPGGAAG